MTKKQRQIRAYADLTQSDARHALHTCVNANVTFLRTRGRDDAGCVCRDNECSKEKKLVCRRDGG